jgi:hypothetical protein
MTGFMLPDRDVHKHSRTQEFLCARATEQRRAHEVLYSRFCAALTHIPPPYCTILILALRNIAKPHHENFIIKGTSAPPVPLSSHILISSYPHILTSSHPHILTSSHPHILTSSLPHILTSSLPHILTSSLPHFLTSSLPHFLTSSLPH